MKLTLPLCLTILRLNSSVGQQACASVSFSLFIFSSSYFFFHVHHLATFALPINILKFAFHLVWIKILHFLSLSIVIFRGILSHLIRVHYLILIDDYFRRTWVYETFLLETLFLDHIFHWHGKAQLNLKSYNNW